MEEDFRARLLASAPLAALVGTNIDWEERPRGGGLPAITLTLVSRVPTYTYKGADALRPSHVQADVWGRSAKEAILIARLFNPPAPASSILATRATQGATRFGAAFIDSEQSGGTDEVAGGTLVFRRILDLTVWHSPA